MDVASWGYLDTGVISTALDSIGKSDDARRPGSNSEDT